MFRNRNLLFFKVSVQNYVFLLVSLDERKASLVDSVLDSSFFAEALDWNESSVTDFTDVVKSSNVENSYFFSELVKNQRFLHHHQFLMFPEDLL